MKQERKNIKEQLQEKEECFQRKDLEIMSLKEDLVKIANTKMKFEKSTMILNETLKSQKVYAHQDSEETMKIKYVRKKDKNENVYIKFKENSTIQDKILYSQRSPTDKSGLGFNNIVGEIKFGKKTPSWKYGMNIPFSRKQREAIDREHGQYPFNKKSYKEYVQKENQETSSSCQNSYRKDI